MEDFHRAFPAAELHILYGSTEVEPVAHFVNTVASPPVEGEGACVGEIVEGLDCRFLRLHRGPLELNDAGWKELTVQGGAPGEIVVSGEHVCRGYFRDDDAFASSKIVDGEGRIWHRTGDVGYLDNGNRLWLVGRVHNAIVRDGEILFPVEAEAIMKALPFVGSAAYLGLPDEELGERAVAVFSPSRPFTDDMIDRIGKALENAGISVDEVVRVDEIPLDPRHHSKVEYTVLRRRLSGSGKDA
jgi:acyl-CoA synthetase (AMP-forming)/AMP-acid ligase II